MRAALLGCVVAGAVVALAVVSPTIVQAAQDKPAASVNIAGKWQTTLEMEVGNASIVLAFTPDGEKLTGTYTGRYGEYPLTGTIKDRTLDFVVVINAEGTETKMHFTGQVTDTPQGVVLKGSANLGGMGEAGWIARRPS
jgi:hypothetical protein